MSIQNDSITKQDWLSLSHCLCVIFNIFVKDLFNFIRWSINSCLSIQILCEKRDKLKYHLEIWNTNPMDTISIFWFWLPLQYLQSLLTSTTQLLSFGKKKVGVLIYLAFQSFWRWAYLMKMMSLPDEDDEHTWWRWWAYLMKMMSLPDEDEPTWWRWWAYLMKIILETLRAHYIRYLGVYPQESVLLTRYIQVFIPKSLYCSPDIYRCLSKQFEIPHQILSISQVWQITLYTKTFY
jgi:hypothetical protein